MKGTAIWQDLPRRHRRRNSNKKPAETYTTLRVSSYLRHSIIILKRCHCAAADAERNQKKEFRNVFCVERGSRPCIVVVVVVSKVEDNERKPHRGRGRRAGTGSHFAVAVVFFFFFFLSTPPPPPSIELRCDNVAEGFDLFLSIYINPNDNPVQRRCDDAPRRCVAVNVLRTTKIVI